MTLSSCARFPYERLYGRSTPAPRLAAAVTIAAVLFMAPSQSAAVEREASVASDIPQVAADPVRPLAVIDREDIALSGMRTVSDLLVSRQRSNSFGLNRVLVLDSRVAYLINGRRISDSTLDLSTLPISAVKRIEIFSGSAATLHSGHAIAGEINIVLSLGENGVEISVLAARPTDAGGDKKTSRRITRCVDQAFLDGMAEQLVPRPKLSNTRRAAIGTCGLPENRT